MMIVKLIQVPSTCLTVLPAFCYNFLFAQCCKLERPDDLLQCTTARLSAKVTLCKRSDAVHSPSCNMQSPLPEVVIDL